LGKKKRKKKKKKLLFCWPDCDFISSPFCLANTVKKERKKLVFCWLHLVTFLPCKHSKRRKKRKQLMLAQPLFYALTSSAVALLVLSPSSWDLLPPL
jgi:hypothetical protein